MPSSHDFVERCERLAVFGGTFDPVHIGHMVIAETVRNFLLPARILFVPTNEPPHKTPGKITGKEHRYSMLLASVCKEPEYDVSRIEIDRPGKSYTVDTIKTLREICPPNAEITLCMGADSFMEIHTWKDYKELLRNCGIAVVSRKGFTGQEELSRKLTKEHGTKIHILEIPLIEVSSTMIRERFANGESAKSLMPREAEEYAKKNGLYTRQGTELGEAHFEEVKTKIKQILSPRRFLHTLGVIEEAEKLARHYNEDEKMARWAALLHDCTKEYSAAKKRKLCETWNIPIDKVLEENIDIAHSLLSAESAKRDYGIEACEVYSAIKYHTTGNKNMSMLDKIIYLADFIEPYRDDYPPLEEMRKYAYENIDKALLVGCKHTTREIKQRGGQIHPWSKAALKDIKGKVEASERT